MFFFRYFFTEANPHTLTVRFRLPATTTGTIDVFLVVLFLLDCLKFLLFSIQACFRKGEKEFAHMFEIRFAQGRANSVQMSFFFFFGKSFLVWFSFFASHFTDFFRHSLNFPRLFSLTFFYLSFLSGKLK